MDCTGARICETHVKVRLECTSFRLLQKKCWAVGREIWAPWGVPSPLVLRDGESDEPEGGRGVAPERELSTGRNGWSLSLQTGTPFFFSLILTQWHFSPLFLERERDKSMRERNIDQLPLIGSPTGDRTHNLGMCPDRELNLQHFGLQDDAPTHWATLTRTQRDFFYVQVKVKKQKYLQKKQFTFEKSLFPFTSCRNIPPNCNRTAVIFVP